MKQTLLFLLGIPLLAAPKLAILPSNVSLTKSVEVQHLLAESVDGVYQQDLTRKVQWSSSNPQIATVDQEGLVRPVGDGQAIISAKAEGLDASVTVHVSNAKTPYTYSFRNDVIPVMSKVGCNQGACHGALAGKNGFKLTLRGYDPVTDYATLTRQSVGRRVSLADPGSSLMLLKPTFTIPHGGGRRFAVNSPEYKILSGWIAEGAPAPTENDAQVTGLEVYPAAATLKAGSEQQLVVRAKFSDGHVEDVTKWVKYSSNNEGVATVDNDGLVKMIHEGEAAVTLWYSSRVLYSRLTVPYANQIASDVYDKFPRSNYIDDLVIDKLKKLNIAPSKVCDDSAFIRRAYLDSAGILPTAEEVEEFLDDHSPDKRAKLIDRLLDRPEFIDYWAYKWSDLLLVSSRKLSPTAMWSFYDWIRENVKENTSWKKMALDIFTASGSTRQNGALNYFVLHKDPIELTENATEAFLGQNVTCARCHNHPLEKWTNTQYYALVNLFARVGVKNGSTPGDAIIFAKTTGNVLDPHLLKPLPPTPLDGKPMSLESTDDRRLVFASWLTSKDNPYFARNVANRVWGNFMGRGIVNPVDDLRATNPASNEELLSALSKDFAAHNYDVKYLIRTIMNSTVYQLSSDANATNKDDNIFYSKYIVKRLPAEVILDELSQVTGVPTTFSGYPLGTRALQLPDSQVKSQFLTVFGRPVRKVCDSSERNSDPTVAQALHIINGDTLNEKLSAKNGYAALFLKLGLSDDRIIEHVYLSAYSRYPTESEKKELVDALHQARLVTGTPEARLETRQDALEDVLWALLTSKEFFFNY